jgi:hypothetical protein
MIRIANDARPTSQEELALLNAMRSELEKRRLMTGK